MKTLVNLFEMYVLERVVFKIIYIYKLNTDDIC
jgi:hypothetical protein